MKDTIEVDKKGVMALVGALALILILAWMNTSSTQKVPDIGYTQSLDDPAPEGALKIVEFSDFKCPYCSKAAETVGQIRDEYGDRIHVEYKHFPLSFHIGSDLAAEASECARDQDRFWDFHDAVFEKFDKKIDVGRRDVLDTIAQEIGLDTGAFAGCLSNGIKKGKVQADIQAAESLGVTGTPSFVIGTQFAKGAIPYEKFKELVDSELAKV